MASACTQNLNQTPVNSLVTIDSPLRNLNPQTAKKPGLVLIQLLKDTRSQMFRSFVTHQKFHYLLWSTTRLWSDTSCPSCGCNMQVSTLKRKWLVTRLIECSACGLRYRVPKLSQEQSDKFYQNDYSQGLTTEMPSVTELEQLKAANFKNTEKDYSKYLRTLSAAKIPVGATILDFGCSWGYGSWQLVRAGYRVFSYEISKPRADYAKKYMGCRLLQNPAGQVVDCLFSAHVIEHLPDPCSLWRLAKTVVRPGGKVVLFTPDGDAVRHPQYHKWWGLAHPCLITTRWMDWAATRAGFERQFVEADGEMTYVAQRNGGSG